ncbi:MAG: DUF4397 domain-containing protein [Gemmatimonadaceae bacterium]|nr:DUF4397 domain-containing protein [Gemmatimonadaceae bacterium]
MRPISVVVALAAVTATACSSDSSGNPVLHPVPSLAYVRYFNAVGDTLALDFRPIDALEFSTPFIATPFRAQGLGGYQGYSTGSRRVRVFPNSTDLVTTTSVLVDTTLSLSPSVYYTITHVGYARSGASPRQRLWISTDTFPTVAAGNVAFRVANAGPDLGAVDVYVTSAANDPLPAAPTFAAVSFLQRSGYAQRPVGAFVMRVYAAGDRGTPLIAATTMAVGSPGDQYLGAIGGSGQSGTVATAMLYSKATPGSAAAITAGANANGTPRLYYWIDRQPPRPSAP